MNVWDDAVWDYKGGEHWTGGAWARRGPRGDRLGASLYELPPGATGGLYHFHHGAEELLVVLAGRPRLRTPDGERQLEEGDVVHFRRGPDGSHQLLNRTSEPVRYLMVSNRESPEVVEYPDSGQLTAMALTDSQYGGPLWTITRLERDPDA